MAKPWHEVLGLRWPIVQAPMAGVQGSALAIAASRAGILGSLPAAMLGADALKAELQRLHDAKIGAYNVNFFCHVQRPLEPASDAAWRACLAPHYQALGLDPRMELPTASRAPVDAAIIDVVEPFAPRVMSFHFGLPSPELLARVKRWGAIVLSSATTEDEARWLEAHGADAIVAQGVEAGGHRGMFLRDDVATQPSLMALLPRVVDAVKVPVIAAGAIGDARTARAAFAMGAQAVQVGSAFLGCQEASTNAVHRAALRSDAARSTALSNVFTGRPARGIVNRIMKDLGPMSAHAPAFPHASAALAPLRAKAESMGSGDYSPLWSGAGGCAHHDVPVAEVVAALSKGCVVG